MTNQLKERISKYNLSEQMIDYINNVEEIYNDIRLSDDNNPENSFSFCEWIEENTDIEEFNNLSKRDKFFYGFGFLSSELAKEMRY